MKPDVWGGGRHVPFIVCRPEMIAAGASGSEVVCPTGLMATSAAIEGSKLPAGAGGSYNISPAMMGVAAYDPLIRGATIHHSINGGFAARWTDKLYSARV
ncbi:hypothetical protein MNBD_BACTEROID01-810 [hydrothermal vent metagenome]|uniref:Uncharacterized protein n=1 Tax=hydrothermal vent metagenome TaxID=652676 RepID=A0A3B0TUD3_9ZZZZ